MGMGVAIFVTFYKNYGMCSRKGQILCVILCINFDL